MPRCATIRPRRCFAGDAGLETWRSAILPTANGAPHPRKMSVIVRRDECRFEIQCHGGRAAIARVCKTLEEAGVEMVPWSEAVRRSRGGIAAETALALSRCACASALPHLLAQHNGAFEQEVLALRTLIDHDPSAVMLRLERLVDRAEFALHLTEPWRVVHLGAT